MHAGTLRAFNSAANIYVRRVVAEPQGSDSRPFRSPLTFFPASFFLAPSDEPPVSRVVAGVFNKVNFKTPARTEIKFNASHRSLGSCRLWCKGGLRRIGRGDGWLEDRRGLKNAVASSQLSLQGFLRAWGCEREEGDSEIVFC